MQDVNEFIDILPENKDDEVLSSAESRPKGEIYGAGIDQFLMSFYGNPYNLGKNMYLTFICHWYMERRLK